MIVQGENYRACHQGFRISLVWYEKSNVWAVLRLPTVDEHRVRPERARVSATYTIDELKALEAVGWSFRATT